MYSKRDRILDSATWLFTKFGLKKTTVDDISKASKCGKGTIYLYFKTKDQIFHEVVRREGRQIVDAIETAVASAPTTAGKVEAFFDTGSEAFNKYVNFYQISLEVFEEIESESAKEIRKEFMASLAAIVGKILIFSEKHDGRKIEERMLVSLAIVSCLDALKGPWFFKGRAMNVHAKSKALSRLVLSGISA